MTGKWKVPNSPFPNMWMLTDLTTMQTLSMGTYDGVMAAAVSMKYIRRLPDGQFISGDRPFSVDETSRPWSPVFMIAFNRANYDKRAGAVRRAAGLQHWGGGGNNGRI